MTTARDVIAASDCVWHFCAQHKKICLAEADRMIAALEAAGISLTQWQSIETAPDDASTFLACRIEQSGTWAIYSVRATYWCRLEDEWFLEGEDVGLPFTHWSPLPTPPKVKP